MNRKIPALPPIAILTVYPAGGGYPERNTFSFALTIPAGYVEMHKLMFFDAEIFC
jgi:hypothetical protein